MDSNYIITPKQNLLLRRIGRKYMIVEQVDGCINLTNVYTMNHTAARLWKAVCSEHRHSAETLAQLLCREYGVEYTRALGDVTLQLEEWRMMGLIVF